ncbi:MAG: hydrogenase iron-sulfur subunit [Armatimonadetes bacterium]|nr:hydrogenase iron-sulfur subunit [Armatimonadota bacterium]
MRVETEAPPQAEATGPAEADWEPRIVGILCYWCSYAGADLAGSSRMSYPANIRIVRVPCSGRVDPLFVLRAFERGADGVLVAGCHPGDCHYAKGNYYARRRLSLLKRLVAYVGIPAERFKALWVSASEGREFAAVVNEMTEELRPLGPFRPELATRFAELPMVVDEEGPACPVHVGAGQTVAEDHQETSGQDE